MSKKKINKAPSIILLSIFLIAIIYSAGLYTGVIFSKKIESRTNANILELSQNIHSIEDDIQEMQITESFINSLGENSCEAADILESLGINEELSNFWSILPGRLEEYEQNNPITKEYAEIKDKYMFSSFRSWIIVKNIYNTCESSPIPLLYFYSRECSDCIQQGEILDAVSENLKKSGKEVRIFTIDYETNNKAIELAKKYYDVKSVPTIIIGDTKISSNLISEDDLMKKINNY